MRFGIVLVAALSLPAPLMAAVYTCEDKEGRTVFRDAPCRTEQAVPSARKRSSSVQRVALAESGERVTREQVKEFLDRMDTALARRDVKGVLALMAKNVEVEFEVKAAGQTRELLFTKAEYGKYLRDALKRMPAEAPRREKERISVSKKEPRATVSFVSRDAVHVDGEVFAGQVKGKIMLERVDGKLLIRRYAGVLKSAGGV